MVTKEDKLLMRDRLVYFANKLGFSVELESSMPDYLEEAQVQLREAVALEQITEEEFAEYFNEDGELQQEIRPAGDCHYLKRRIRVREGKGLNGQISTLVHELAHILGLGGQSWLSYIGEGYIELASESVTEIVTQAVGIDRTEQTFRRILNYGFAGYLVSPVTVTISEILIGELNGV